ncbi:phosphotransferase system lactose/cellobiose-specific IIB subunit [Coriobacterium glomerans PW2]|uniref:Phosphotransferase system lactose/cellobiose-specific IIB subunit n=1 Tax=Coriobacterium glomerans (strain ATCC 49209 / DSM 20642 / JCM 10262 / PW2) TaxID=700015 RepID=F2N7H3_CORGP|nr:PTS sugar transporter subunit IIB [Coriobacterium glomerans]AEB06789.1 phosphotransferase system lactose/cellobiose-specific IIB subunit [Coriobacterium glomerans PW2]
MESITRIMCACGSGLGSSLLVEMNIKEVLGKLGICDVQVFHSVTGDIRLGAADLFVVGRDLASFIPEEIPEEQRIILTNIVDRDELENKLAQVFGLQHKATDA